jgi:adenylate cyclase
MGEEYYVFLVFFEMFIKCLNSKMVNFDKLGKTAKTKIKEFWMANEIERKFLVKEGTDIKGLGDAVRITQGYLSSIKERSVRVRIYGEKAFLTIKGIGNESGTTRYEFEKEISVSDAIDLLKICEPGVIDKTRTKVISGKHTFEVDCFLGYNLGLIVAEVELESEQESFNRPEWLGVEVTGDSKYYNSALIKNPFCKW